MSSRLRRRLLYYLPRFRYFLIGALLGILILGLWKIIPPTSQALRSLSLGSSIFWSVVTDRPPSLKETSGRTNLLLLGRPGGNHEGANLTDTIIFLSLNLKTYEITMISLPRDIWVDSLKSKINSAYEFGEEKKEGGGLILTKAVVSDLFGQPVHYGVLVDFSGFKKTVDLLGGLTIEVENPLDDYKYPIEGKENDFCDGDPEYKCRFEHLHFEAGLQQMDGERVLKYVRSRQAEGEEGTDFARAKRQQKVLLALRAKILSGETLLNPGRILALKKILSENILTDIPKEEIGDFVKVVKKLNAGKIKTVTLDTGDEERGQSGFLINPPTWEYNGAWVLVPRTGDWQEIQKYLETQLTTPN